MNIKNRIKIISLCVVILIITTTFYFNYDKLLVQYLPQKFFCLKKNQFLYDVKKSENNYIKSDKSIYKINNEGTINYVYENFDEQKDQSFVLEQFESLKNLNINSNIVDISLNKEKINGINSLAINVKPEILEANKIIIRSDFINALNLNRWDNHGFLSGWVKIENRHGIESINVKIGDSKGHFREFRTLLNLQVDLPNFFNEDDIYPDIKYPISNSVSDEWTDFWLNNGWNYLLWRTDKGFYSDAGSVDMVDIKWIEIILVINKNMNPQTILFDDFRIQDGLQKDENPIGQFWYPPHGRPQYGNFDIDKITTTTGDYALKLLNVRQTQYPSNGDHGRMISKANTPLNFAMRVMFQITDLAKEGKRDNTWLRIMYDFDPEWDPGHDWFGLYQSFEWNKFGLITVIPIERFFVQDQEPKKESISLSSKNFFMEENKKYEIHLTIEGQNAIATLYSVGDNCLKIKNNITYKFLRERYDERKRYPISLEVTGDVKAIIHEIEIFEL